MVIYYLFSAEAQLAVTCARAETHVNEETYCLLMISSHIQIVVSVSGKQSFLWCKTQFIMSWIERGSQRISDQHMSSSSILSQSCHLSLAAYKSCSRLQKLWSSKLEPPPSTTLHLLKQPHPGPWQTIRPPACIKRFQSLLESIQLTASFNLSKIKLFLF